MKNGLIVGKAIRKYKALVKYGIEELERIDYITDKTVDEMDVIVGEIVDASQDVLNVIAEYQHAKT